MGKFVKGAVVVLPFPFSDLSSSKKRPAMVISPLDGDDLILCQITTRLNRDRYSINLSNTDFVSGDLPQDSSIRPNRLFTADSNIIIKQAGTVQRSKTDEVVNKIIEIIVS
jgi:mRNA interferase MazF